MTANAFRKLALSLPEAVESAHMGHPDFRVRGKIFATLGPDESWGMVKLTLEQQGLLIQAEPAMFRSVPGGWGRRGATKVILEDATAAAVRPALAQAWRNVAPKQLIEESDVDA
jgi:hypothetical protein